MEVDYGTEKKENIVKKENVVKKEVKIETKKETKIENKVKEITKTNLLDFIFTESRIKELKKAGVNDVNLAFIQKEIYVMYSMNEDIQRDLLKSSAARYQIFSCVLKGVIDGLNYSNNSTLTDYYIYKRNDKTGYLYSKSPKGIMKLLKAKTEILFVKPIMLYKNDKYKLIETEDKTIFEFELKERGIKAIANLVLAVLKIKFKSGNSEILFLEKSYIDKVRPKNSNAWSNYPERMIEKCLLKKLCRDLLGVENTEDDDDIFIEEDKVNKVSGEITSEKGAHQKENDVYI